MRLIDAEFEENHYASMLLSPTPDVTEEDKHKARIIIAALRMAKTVEPEPHWIPVTERLPETTDAVLTTYIVNGDRSRRYVEESSYYGSDESWSSPWDEYRIAGTRIEVIAWMPLPESYKGVTE